MPASSLGHNPVYRREARMGHPRHWWRRHKPLCLLLALGMGVASWIELIAAPAASWGPAQAAAMSHAMTFVFLIFGPFHSVLSLQRDLHTRMVESIVLTEVTPQTYLQGKLFASLRPAFLLLAPLWLRSLLIEIRFNANLSALAGLGESELICASLIQSSLSFVIEALLLVLGVLCYGSLGLAMTLRFRSASLAMSVVALLALLIDVWGPAGLRHLIESRGPGLADYAIGVLFGLSVGLIFLKYMLYRYLMDCSAARLRQWAFG